MTADTTNNDVDNDLEITFAADATFEGAITGVSFNGTALTATTDYVVSSGKITLKPGGGNAALRTPATANVVVAATGYDDSTVAQTITAGAVASLTVTQQPAPGAASGDAFATQPVVTLKDQYNNTCATGPSATANVVATPKAGTGAWIIGGTSTLPAVAGVATFTDLTCTVATPGNGAITFTSGTPAVDSSTFTIPTSAQTATASAATLGPAAGANNAITLTVKDSGNTDTTFNGVHNVTVSGYTAAPDSSYGTFNGTALTTLPQTISVTFTNGVVSSDLVLNNASAQTIGFSIAGVNTLETNTISITPVPASAASMTLTQEITAPLANGGQFAQQPEVTLKDAFGNTCTNDNTTVVTASKKDAGSWTLTGITTATASAGVATFTNLGATNAAAVNGAQLAFDVAGLTQITSSSVTLKPPGLAIVTGSLPSGTVGTSYSANMTATGGITPYTWSVTGLPAGLSLDTVTGLVYGIPTSAGTSSVAATVYDRDRQNASANFSLTINSPDDLAIITSSLPSGTVGTFYSETLTATGGITPYNWSAGGLPPGLGIDASSGIISGIPGAAGTSTVTAMVYDSGSQSASIDLSLAVEEISGNGRSSSSSTDTSTQNNDNIDVFVNGQKQEQSATAVTTTENGKTVTIVTVDEKKLEEKLNAEGEKAVLTIPVNTGADAVIWELNGQMVKNMESKQAAVEIKTDLASYTLPAQQINIDAVSEQIGTNVELKDIKVRIEISKSPEETVKIIENSAKAGEYTIIAPPVEFKVTCTYEDKTVEVSRYNSYVERTIAIPDGVDPTKITTGVVLNSDGTVTHVPTKIVVIDGKYYAKINSLTNSVYMVIGHSKTFSDVENHWARNYVNEMGSRLIIKGIGENNFAPDRDITRAEFVSIVGRALGLRDSGAANRFSDVKESDWFCGAVSTAYEYGIISGYGDGTFKPEKAITREEAMEMIARAMKIAGMDVNISDTDAVAQLAVFKDKDGVDGWAKKSAAACVKNDIIVGSNGMLTPDNNITRAETATIVIRTLQKAKLI